MAEQPGDDTQALAAVGLHRQKALIANSAYRRYLRCSNPGKAFEIDPG